MYTRTRLVLFGPAREGDQQALGAYTFLCSIVYQCQGAYELAYACHIHTLETHFTHTTPPLLVDLLNVLETMSITHIGSLSELNKILSKSNDKITVSRMDQMRGND